MNFKMIYKKERTEGLTTSFVRNITIQDSLDSLKTPIQVGDKIVSVFASGWITPGYFLGNSKGGLATYLVAQNYSNDLSKFHLIVEQGRHKIIKAEWLVNPQEMLAHKKAEEVIQAVKLYASQGFNQIEFNANFE